jgi:RNA polymerase sigma-32 factor
MRSEGQLYLDHIKTLKIIPKKEQIDLMKEWKNNNNNEAFEKVYKSNLKIVPRIVCLYKHPNHNQFMDIIQEGNIALLKALRKYNPEHNTSVTYYSFKFVKRIILRFIITHDKIIKYRLNKTNISVFGNLKGVKYIFSKPEGVEDRIKDLSEETGISIEKIRTSISHLKINFVYLDRLVHDDNNHYTHHDVVANNSNVFEDFANLEIKNKLNNIINNSKISTRNKKIIKEYYFNDRTYQNIGNEFGLSRERIRQIINNSISHLKSNIKKENLYP